MSAPTPESLLTEPVADEVSSSPLPSRLLSLPLELQSVIARMCHEQDAAYKQRLKISRHRLQEATKVFTKEYKWYGRSIYALYETCKSLSMLARPYVFETLKLSEAVDPLFCSSILASHGELFRHLVFNASHDACPNAFRGLLASTLKMPNITQLSFTTNAYGHQLGNLIPSKPVESLANVAERFALDPALARLGTNVTKLSGANLSPTDLAAAVELWPNIKHLSLKCSPGSSQSHYHNRGRPHRTPRLVDVGAIANLVHLDTLEIGTDHEFGSFNLDTCLAGMRQSQGGAPPPPAWEALPEEVPVRLRCLRVATRRLRVDIWTFICSFSATLEELHLEIFTFDTPMKDDAAKNGSGTYAAFPRLHTLSLTGATGLGWIVLRLLEHSPLESIDLKFINLRPDSMRDLFHHKGRRLFSDSLITLGVNRYGSFPHEGSQELLTEDFIMGTHKLGVFQFKHDPTYFDHYSFYRTDETLHSDQLPESFGKRPAVAADCVVSAWTVLERALESVAFANLHEDTQWIDMANLAMRPLTALMMAVND